MSCTAFRARKTASGENSIGRCAAARQKMNADQIAREMDLWQKPVMKRITNLVKNAMEAMEDQTEPHLFIAIRQADENFVTVNIADTGVGIPPEGLDMSDWVLSPMDSADEDVILGLLPELVRGVEVWGVEGMETAMNDYNR